MFQETLFNKQPTIYHSLKNSMQKGRLAHAFLISGKQANMKKDLAYLMAQSIVENNNDFACETCNTCLRIKDHNYADLIYLDGDIDSIKVEDIEYIQNKFSKYAIENAQKKIYIINHFENTVIAAQNKLLKFLEEPNGNDTYAILITNNDSKVLPTIISRCQRIKLILNKYEDIQKAYINLGYDPVLSHYLAHIINDVDLDLKEDMAINKAYESIQLFIKSFPDDLDYYLYTIHQNIFSINDKAIQIKTMKYLLNMMILFIKDMINPSNLKEDWYNKEYSRINKIEHIDLILEYIIESLDKTNIVFNHQLVMESLIYKIRSVNNGNKL